MKKSILSITIFVTTMNLSGQECSCEGSKISGRIDCDKEEYKNETFLYYQYNCDSIWLTVENKKGNSFIVFSMEPSLDNYNWRRLFRIEKDLKNKFLFRYSYPADNSPWEYVLINKLTGKAEKYFDHLVYSGKEDHFDFVIYLGQSRQNLIVYDLMTGQTSTVDIDPKRFTAPIPQQQFTGSRLTDEYLELTYNYLENNEIKTDKIKIEIKKYAR